MKKNDLILCLEDLKDILDKPLYNSLEVGFRHSPLSQTEMIERYRQTCYTTKEDLRVLIQILKDSKIEE